jgi:hypothetical protein
MIGDGCSKGWTPIDRFAGGMAACYGGFLAKVFIEMRRENS